MSKWGCYVLKFILAVLLSSSAIAGQGLPQKFSAKTFASKVQIFEDMEKSSPILMHFWAPWCHSCSTVLWDLDPILDQYKSLRFLSINIDKDMEAARKYIQKHKLYSKYEKSFFTSPSENLIKDLAVISIPTILIVDSSRKVVFRTSSHINGETHFNIKKTLETLLRKEST